MRTHPPALLKLVARTLREECAVTHGTRIIVAVSGGPDSLALLHVLALLRSQLQLQLLACGVDHGLRAEAQQELQLAAQCAAQCGVDFRVRQVHVERGSNLQARARNLRYAALEAMRLEWGAELVATGHHADDRAETVLLRLLRGSGPAGLAVLPARAGRRLRPQIRARRTHILSHLERHGVPFACDPSNVDPRFARTRVRQELLPLLEALSPGIVGHLTTLADELSEAPLPLLTDEQGEQVCLNRGQRSQLRRALRHQQRGARVLLSAGLAIEIDQESGQPRLVPSDPSLPRRPGPPQPRQNFGRRA
jgi:tRNA(Ile)-lysidine synthase